MITQPAITCTDCRAPLRDTVSLLFGVCEPCRARWTALAVLGTPSRDGIDRRDPVCTRQTAINEVNREAVLDLHRVPCAGCGDDYHMDDVPPLPWYCAVCTVSAVS